MQVVRAYHSNHNTARAYPSAADPCKPVYANFLVYDTELELSHKYVGEVFNVPYAVFLRKGIKCQYCQQWFVRKRKDQEVCEQCK